MTASNSSKGLYWIIFLVSSVIFFGMLIYVPQLFWIPLPFVLTYLVKALDKM